MWNIIVIIASVISISCLIYSEIQLRKSEKHIKELSKMIDEQILEHRRENQDLIKTLLDEKLKRCKKNKERK